MPQGKVIFSKVAEAPPKLKSTKMPVAQWGGDVVVKELSADLYEEINTKLREKFGENWSEKSNTGLMVAMLSECLYDSEGKKPPAEFLGTQSVSLLKTLFREALKLNGISAADQDKLEKN